MPAPTAKAIPLPFGGLVTDLVYGVEPGLATDLQHGVEPSLVVGTAPWSAPSSALLAGILALAGPTWFARSLWRARLPYQRRPRPHVKVG